MTGVQTCALPISKFKYLCVKPDESKDSSNQIRVLYYYGNPHEYVEYLKLEVLVPLSMLTKTVKALIDGDKVIYNSYIVPNKVNRDIFVCTHNSRDQCCGIFGIHIFKKFKELILSDDKVRIWQSSHMGGHRFGPTMLDMPSGKFWGYLNTDVIESIFTQNQDPKSIIKHFRGSMGLDRYSQILDKKLFEELGWEWYYCKKKSEIIEKRESKIWVKIIFKTSNNLGVYFGEIRKIGTVELPETQCAKGTSIKKFEVTDVVYQSFFDTGS